MKITKTQLKEMIRESITEQQAGPESPDEAHVQRIKRSAIQLIKSSQATWRIHNYENLPQGIKNKLDAASDSGGRKSEYVVVASRATRGQESGSSTWVGLDYIPSNDRWVSYYVILGTEEFEIQDDPENALRNLASYLD